MPAIFFDGIAVNGCQAVKTVKTVPVRQMQSQRLNTLPRTSQWLTWRVPLRWRQSWTPATPTDAGSGSGCLGARSCFRPLPEYSNRCSTFSKCFEARENFNYLTKVCFCWFAQVKLNVDEIVKSIVRCAGRLLCLACAGHFDFRELECVLWELLLFIPSGKLGVIPNVVINLTV